MANQSWNLTKQEDEERKKTTTTVRRTFVYDNSHRRVVQLIIHYPYAVDGGEIWRFRQPVLPVTKKPFFFINKTHTSNIYLWPAHGVQAQRILQISNRTCVLLLLLRLTEGLPKRPSPIVEFQLSLWPLSNARHVTTD